jgi:hypothetical protein
MFIPDPTFFHPGSRIRTTVSIPDPGSASKNLSILTPKKWFLSSRKYDLGCSSRIPDPDADFLPIPDPGVKKAPDPGSATLVTTQSSVFHFLQIGIQNLNPDSLTTNKPKVFHFIHKNFKGPGEIESRIRIHIN